MRLELDLDPGDWKDYATALFGDLQRVGVLLPIEPVGVRAFVRLGALTDDGTRVVVMTPWLIWQAAHRALVERLGEDRPPAPEPDVSEAEVLDRAPAEDEPDLPPLLAIRNAMAEHARRWGLDASHDDGTDAASWTDIAKTSRADATAAAMQGDITWAHTLLEAVHAALATEDPDALRQALAAVAGTAANWMTAIEERS